MNATQTEAAGYQGPISPEFGTFEDSTPLLDSPELLLERAEKDGYLFFRGLLPRDEVMELRADMLAILDRYGWRVQDQPSLGGLLDSEQVNQLPFEDLRSDIGVSNCIYHDVQKLESLHRLPHHPQLLNLYRTLFGGRDVLPHARHIVRMMSSHRGLTPTPPHQDFPLIQGTSNTWTCWFPVGDCPRELGGLAVLHGSHRNGYVPVQTSEGAGGIAAQLCPNETRWLTTEYECGDVLTFPSFTIHKGTRPKNRDEIRLSLDIRFQPVDEIIESRSLLPHCGLSWEEIYQDWERDDLKYYWEQLPLNMSEYDNSLMQPGNRAC